LSQCFTAVRLCFENLIFGRFFELVTVVLLYVWWLLEFWNGLKIKNTLVNICFIAIVIVIVIVH